MNISSPGPCSNGNGFCAWRLSRVNLTTVRGANLCATACNVAQNQNTLTCKVIRANQAETRASPNAGTRAILVETTKAGLLIAADGGVYICQARQLLVTT